MGILLRSGTRLSAGTRPRSATNPPASASRPSTISATRSGVGSSLEALARSNRPFVPGLTGSSPTWTVGASSPESWAGTRGDRLELRGVLRARGLLTRVGRACAADALAGAAAALALVGAAGDGGADDLLAVAVLGEVGRQVVERLAQVGVRVLPAESAVVVAVVEHLPRARRRRGRGGKRHECGKQEQMSHDSGHSRCPPGCRSRGPSGAGRRDHGPGEAKLATAQARSTIGRSAWFLAPGPCMPKRLRPGPSAQSCGVPPRVAILPPVPVPYREPLFRALAERGVVEPRVVYLAASQQGWDQPPRVVREPRGLPERGPVGLAAGARRAQPGDRRARARRGARPHRPGLRRELGVRAGDLARARLVRRAAAGRSSSSASSRPGATPRSRELQLRVHRLLAPRVDGFIVASSQGAERLARLGVDRGRVEVALQSADLEPLLGLDRARAQRRAGARARSSDGSCRTRTSPLLLDAFAEAGVVRRGASSCLHGSGPLEAELRERAARLGVAAQVAGPVAPAGSARRVRGRRRARAREHLRALRRDDARGRGGRACRSSAAGARAPRATWRSTARTRCVVDPGRPRRDRRGAAAARARARAARAARSGQPGGDRAPSAHARTPRRGSAPSCG